MLYSKIQVFCSCIFCLVCYLVYSNYMVLLADGIYTQSIQNAQIGTLNAINTIQK